MLGSDGRANIKQSPIQRGMVKTDRSKHIKQLIPVASAGGISQIYPAGIWCQNDVVSTSVRRNHVASTLIRRHFRTKCSLGSRDRARFAPSNR